MIHVTLFGAAGRMGRAIVKALNGESDIRISHAVESSKHCGIDLGGIVTEPESASVVKDCDVVVDVSLPASALEHALLAENAGKPILIGTTGFLPEQLEQLAGLSVPHIIAPNLSVGVNLLFEMLPKMRRILGDAFDVGIVETHHKHKLDAPSGTAKRMAEALNEAGPAVQVVSLRVGEVVGEHRVTFAAEGEQIEVIHRAESRMAFARGVAPAVRFLKDRKPGRFSMSDVLGLGDGKDRS